MKIFLGVILFYCAVVSDSITVKSNGFNEPTMFVEGEESPPKKAATSMELKELQFLRNRRQSSLQQQQQQPNSEIVHQMTSSDPQIISIGLELGEEPATFDYKQHDTYYMLSQEEQQLLSAILENTEQQQQLQQLQPPPKGSGQQENFQLGMLTQEMISSQVPPEQPQQEIPIDNEQDQEQETPKKDWPIGIITLLPESERFNGTYNFTCVICCTPDEMPCGNCCDVYEDLSPTALKIAAG